MKLSALSISACRHCRYYEPEGRRGGQCKILGALVQSSWKSCTLASPAFAPSWENLEDIILWQEESLKQEQQLPAIYPLPNTNQPIPLPLEKVAVKSI